jgi:hypothetical protein
LVSFIAIALQHLEEHIEALLGCQAAIVLEVRPLLFLEARELADDALHLFILPPVKPAQRRKRYTFC